MAKNMEKENIGNPKGTWGGARPGAGRPRNDSESFSFRAGGEVARRLRAMEGRTSFIVGCIEEHLERDRVMAADAAAMADDIPAIGQRLRPGTSLVGWVSQQIVAGYPIGLDSESAEMVDIAECLGIDSDTDFVMKVSGESMIEDGILDGDLILVDSSRREVSPSDIAVCEVDGQYTVKHVVRTSDGGYRLMPANPAYHPIEVRPGDAFSIRGVVKSAFHSFVRR